MCARWCVYLHSSPPCELSTCIMSVQSAYFTLLLHFEFNVESGVRMEFALVTFSLTYTHTDTQTHRETNSCSPSFSLSSTFFSCRFVRSSIRDRTHSFIHSCAGMCGYQQCVYYVINLVCLSVRALTGILLNTRSSCMCRIQQRAYNSLLCFHFYSINIFYSKTESTKKKYS